MAVRHAEMNAITDAGRGRAIRGCRLYVNTFPCHNPQNILSQAVFVMYFIYGLIRRATLLNFLMTLLSSTPMRTHKPKWISDSLSGWHRPYARIHQVWLEERRRTGPDLRSRKEGGQLHPPHASSGVSGVEALLLADLSSVLAGKGSVGLEAVTSWSLNEVGEVQPGVADCFKASKRVGSLYPPP